MTDPIAGAGRRALGAILAASGVAPPADAVHGPTPLEYHAAMSRDLDIEVFVKREDMADALGCGNKVRKLAYIVAEAERHGATVLVTAGSLGSNQCKAVASAAAQRNLRAHVVYGGDTQERPVEARGSYLLTSLLDPELTWCERRAWNELGNELANVVEIEKSRGERPWLIPPGASNWPGLMGSIELGLEIADQAQAAAISVTDVVAPSGSGGTCLGIHLAAERLNLAWRVTGFSIGEDLDVLHENVAALRSKLPFPLADGARSAGTLTYRDSARGAGYDVARSEELSAMQYVACRYGLVFDPNYMIKAFLGLRQVVDSGYIRRGSHVVLIHTGGHMGLFDAGAAFAAWHRNHYPNWVK